MDPRPDHRLAIDPRYVTWEAFDRRAREVDERQNRAERAAELHESAVNTQLGMNQQEITRLRIASARQAVYISLVQTALTVGATAWLTFVFSGRH